MLFIFNYININKTLYLFLEFSLIMASTKEHYLVIQTRKEDQAMLPHFKKLHVFDDALYHPDTNKKMFVFNCGNCIKRDCNTPYSGHKAKVLLPESCLPQFNGDITAEKHIGRVVVCFSHFSFKDRMMYLTQGSFPEKALLVAAKLKKGTPSPAKKTKLRICREALKYDRTWVTLLIYMIYLLL